MRRLLIIAATLSLLSSSQCFAGSRTAKLVCHKDDLATCLSEADEGFVECEKGCSDSNPDANDYNDCRNDCRDNNFDDRQQCYESNCEEENADLPNTIPRPTSDVAPRS